MNTQPLRDQRGVAMLLELVLVAVVLGLVGLALYQSAHRTPTASTTTTPAPAASAVGLAASAATLAEQESAADAALSAEAEASADEVADAAADAVTLEDSSDASF